jgi:hypothetical protein
MGRFAETAIVDYCLSFADRLPFFPFAANKWKFAVSVFHLQQTNGTLPFLLLPFSIYMY